VVTFREAGKGDRRCRVVKIWRDERGRQGYELEMLDTGEHSVIYDADTSSPPPARLRDLTGRIARRNESRVVPDVTPEPPPAPEIPKAVYGLPSGVTTAHIPLDGWKEHRDPQAFPSNVPPPLPRTSYAPNTSGPGARETADNNAVENMDWRQSWNQAPDSAAYRQVSSVNSTEAAPPCTDGQCVECQECTEGPRLYARDLLRKMRQRFRQADGDDAASGMPSLPANVPNAFSPAPTRRADAYPVSDQAGNMWNPSMPVDPRMPQADPVAVQPASALGPDGWPAAPPAQSNPLASVNPRDHQQLMNILCRAAYPSQREWAAETLASQWTLNASIIPALAKSAKDDPAPSVRATCIQCLSRIQASAAPATNALENLKAASLAIPINNAIQAPRRDGSMNIEQASNLHDH
jgi:hypothetical protein